MIKHNQNGAVNGLVISLVFAVLFLIGALSFGGWAFSSRSDYKDNSDAKSAAAVKIAIQKEDTAKDAAYVEASKSPLTTYNGPEASGSIVLKYPKTWSGYVDDTGKGKAPVDGYFSPSVVPSINDPASAFSLQIQVVDQPYAQVVQTFTNQQKQGVLSASAYSLPKLPNVAGLKLVGAVSPLPSQSAVTMVVMPLRSQTIELWTEGNVYLNDFNTYILPNFSFSP